MKKNILIFLMVVSPFFIQPFVCAHDSMQEFSAVCEQASDTDGVEEQEFDDFFGEPDETPTERPKKEKWSPARIAMVKLGVATALGIQRVYGWLQAMWVYLLSWVPGETNKA